MVKKHARNDFEQMILDNIRKYGWHCNSVFFDPDSFEFAYTVGLFHSYGHPELLVFGLPAPVAHGVFTVAAKSIASGAPLDKNAPINGLLANYACVLVEVPKRYYDEFVLSARWLYNGNRFPLLQVVWPSEEGHFPWHPNVADWMATVQPVLGQVSRGA